MRFALTLVGTQPTVLLLHYERHKKLAVIRSYALRPHVRQTSVLLLHHITLAGELGIAPRFLRLELKLFLLDHSPMVAGVRIALTEVRI